MDFISILPNKYKRLPCGDIFIPRNERQRSSIDTSDIDQSIKDRGVLQPIIVRQAQPEDDTQLSWVIVAGERRLASSLKLGIPDIPARLGSELSKLEWELIELEENVKRSDLAWQDEVKATAKIHKLLSVLEEDWTIAKTAKYIGAEPSTISRTLRVAQDLSNPRIAGADGIRPAWNILARLDDRRGSDIINSLVETGAGAFLLPSNPPAPNAGAPISLAPVPVPQKVKDSILNEDFLLWAPKYSGPRFNFIHMDPPYGIGVFSGAMSGRGSHDTYSDSADDYWKILHCLCKNIDRLMTPSSHLMLWFSMEHYTSTLEFFQEYAPGLNFSPFPLLWVKSDNVGILPDPKRGPRRIYETALVASREDHLIVRAVSNAYSAPTDKTYHPSTKPEPMLRHFFQMFVDDTTRILDPTCGSGSALRAAESLGALEVLGLEKDPKHFEAAQTALKSFRNLKRASK